MATKTSAPTSETEDRPIEEMRDEVERTELRARAVEARVRWYEAREKEARFRGKE
jgi:hypothetical protein